MNIVAISKSLPSADRWAVTPTEKPTVPKADAISRQAHTLMHTSNLYYSLPQLELAGLLLEATGMEGVFFTNSGAEANEAAIKMARKWGQ